MYWNVPKPADRDNRTHLKQRDLSATREFDNALKKIAKAIGILVLSVCVAVIFEQLRGFIPDYIHYHTSRYAVAFDRFLFGCQLNTVVQHAFRMHQLSVIFTDIWFTYMFVLLFSVPAIYMLRSAPHSRYWAALVMVLISGLLIYAIIPTAPPWMALKSVSRLNLNHLAARDPNPTAAMPSIHLAVTSLLCCVMWESRHIAMRIVGSVYVFLMAFGLLYLGEHYFLDLIAGFALAILCWKVSGKVLRPRREADGANTGLEVSETSLSEEVLTAR